ncbi:hypothetical protein [Halorubrum halophilum]|nr:hypothetical protein [Halorubrum halophilum]
MARDSDTHDRESIGASLRTCTAFAPVIRAAVSRQSRRTPPDL